VSVRPADVKALLLDIEGTTTPLAFVSEVLFPYVRAHVRAYLDEHAASPGYASLIDRLHDEHQRCRHRGETPPGWTVAPDQARIASAIAFVEWLMDRDRKSTPLKEVQGLIWEEGYQRGALVGQVFPDVPPALRRWHDQHLSVCIYSSGSVLAQRLLFRHSTAGDLTGFFHSFFDTNVGTKTDPASYRRIGQSLGLSTDAIAFLSDSPRELDAARNAGMRVRLVIRPGNVSLTGSHDFDALHSFDEI
jgi:2,3-diketo-5-methylthio-1-phosphopentane phosphatase